MFSQTSATTAFANGGINTLRRGVMVLAVCASIGVASVRSAGSAEARVPEGERTTQMEQICGKIQDVYDVASAGPRLSTPRTIEEAKLQVTKAEAQWNKWNCGHWFGSIAKPRFPQKTIVSPSSSLVAGDPVVFNAQ